MGALLGISLKRLSLGRVNYKHRNFFEEDFWNTPLRNFKSQPHTSKHNMRVTHTFELLHLNKNKLIWEKTTNEDYSKLSILLLLSRFNKILLEKARKHQLIELVELNLVSETAFRNPKALNSKKKLLDVRKSCLTEQKKLSRMLSYFFLTEWIVGHSWFDRLFWVFNLLGRFLIFIH